MPDNFQFIQLSEKIDVRKVGYRKSESANCPKYKLSNKYMKLLDKLNIKKLPNERVEKYQHFLIIIS